MFTLPNLPCDQCNIFFFHSNSGDTWWMMSVSCSSSQVSSASQRVGSSRHNVSRSRKRSNTNVPDVRKPSASAVRSSVQSSSRKHSSADDVDKNVLRFVYGEAVDIAMRHKYTSSAYPSLPVLNSEHSTLIKQSPKIKVVEILKLPQIYDDLRSVRTMRKKNVLREKRWRDRMAKKGISVFDTSKLDEPSRKVSTIKLPKIPWKLMGMSNMLTAKHSGGGNDGERSPNVKK